MEWLYDIYLNKWFIIKYFVTKSDIFDIIQWSIGPNPLAGDDRLAVKATLLFPVCANVPWVWNEKC